MRPAWAALDPVSKNKVNNFTNTEKALEGQWLGRLLLACVFGGLGGSGGGKGQSFGFVLLCFVFAPSNPG